MALSKHVPADRGAHTHFPGQTTACTVKPCSWCGTGKVPVQPEQGHASCTVISLDRHYWSTICEQFQCATEPSRGEGADLHSAV